MEKILVVDDEQGLRDVLSIMLKRAGYAVTVASDGDEAIAQVQKEVFGRIGPISSSPTSRCREWAGSRC